MTGFSHLWLQPWFMCQCSSRFLFSYSWQLFKPGHIWSCFICEACFPCTIWNVCFPVVSAYHCVFLCGWNFQIMSLISPHSNSICLLLRIHFIQLEIYLLIILILKFGFRFGPFLHSWPLFKWLIIFLLLFLFPLKHPVLIVIS